MFADLDEASAGEEVATNGFTAAAVVEAIGAERGASGEAFAGVDASKPDESGFLAGSGSIAGGMEAVVVTASVCAAFWLMEPVTDSNPCSSAAIRANSRSRSPFNVSIADEKASYFLLGRFRDLQLRRLLCEIGGDDLVGPETGAGIVSQESDDYGSD